MQQLSTNFRVTALKTNAVSKNKALLETGDWGSRHLTHDITFWRFSLQRCDTVSISEQFHLLHKFNIEED